MRSNITKPFHINCRACSLPVRQAGRGGVVNSEVTLVQLWRMRAGIVILSLSFLPFLKKKPHPTFPGQEFQSLNDFHTSQSIDYAPAYRWKPVLTQEACCAHFTHVNSRWGKFTKWHRNKGRTVKIPSAWSMLEMHVFCSWHGKCGNVFKKATSFIYLNQITLKHKKTNCMSLIITINKY